VQSRHGWGAISDENAQPSNAQRPTSNSEEVNLTLRCLFGFRELSKGSCDIKKNGAAKLFSNLQLSGACASLEEPLT
jgi:hypothetical protein